MTPSYTIPPHTHIQASAIERHLGTLHYGLVLGQLTALTGIVHTVIALVLDICFEVNHYGNQCSLGFSGL